MRSIGVVVVGRNSADHVMYRKSQQIRRRIEY
jgi:hypothetical protein